MKAKRLLSVVLAVVMVLSCATLALTAVNASAADYNVYDKYLESIKPENKYGLEDTVNEGKILQAWNWSYANTIDLLETVAEQGFTTIQISPPNEIKMATKGVKVCEPVVNGVAPNGWWMFYQPAGFQLNESDDNALGTKAEYIEMCEKAHELGLKIIADAVINHMGTDDDHTKLYTNTSTDPMDHVNPRAAEFEPELLAAKAFHTPWAEMTYKENYWDGWSDYDIEYDLTRNCTSGLPDLATETQLVQDTIYDYLEELVLAGTDGFRFDAAKHIETEHDTYVASDFWTDTLLKLRNNYPEVECYAYGEILNKCGDGRPFSEYTELMDVTDSSSYWGIKDTVLWGNGSGTPYYQSEAEGCDPTTVNFTKENVIQWNESHDTYIDGGTTSLTIEQRNKIWALTAARQEITGVYFARPTDDVYDMNGDGQINRADAEALCADIFLGDANVTSWASPEVAAVNQFDNFFGNASEYNTSYDKVTLIERADQAERIVGATLVNVGGTTKNLYEMPTYRLPDGKYIDAITNAEFTVTDGKLSGRIGETGIAVIYFAEDKEWKLPALPFDPYSYPVDWQNGTFPEFEGYTTLVLSSRDWDVAYSYCWVKGTENCLKTWPGTPMKKLTDDNGYGEKQFIAYIPAAYDMYIINNGNGGGSNQTADLSVPASAGVWLDHLNSNGNWEVGYWTPTFIPTPIPTEPEDATPGEGTTVTTPGDDTTATTPGEKPTVGGETYVIGDADSDGTVNIKDATIIQKYIADLDVNNFGEDAADANLDGTINIKDATEIQKWIADLLTDSLIGTDATK